MPLIFAPVEVLRGNRDPSRGQAKSLRLQESNFFFVVYVSYLTHKTTNSSSGVEYGTKWSAKPNVQPAPHLATVSCEISPTMLTLLPPF